MVRIIKYGKWVAKWLKNHLRNSRLPFEKVVPRLAVYYKWHRYRKELFRSHLRSHFQKAMPLAYIVGTQSFVGAKLACRPPVLIPRGETEEMVCWTMNHFLPSFPLPHPDPLAPFYATGQPFRILDIGSGTGCIALGLNYLLPYILHRLNSPFVFASCVRLLGLKESMSSMVAHLPVPYWIDLLWRAKRDSSSLSQVQQGSFINTVSIDYSDIALTLAKENEAALRSNKEYGDLGNPISWLSWNIFDEIPSSLSMSTFDLIIANPPYIPAEKIPALSKRVRLWEDWSALNGDRELQNVENKYSHPWAGRGVDYHFQIMLLSKRLSSYLARKDNSHSSIPFLVMEINGEDQIQPLIDMANMLQLPSPSFHYDSHHRCRWVAFSKQ